MICVFHVEFISLHLLSWENLGWKELSRQKNMVSFHPAFRFSVNCKTIRLFQVAFFIITGNQFTRRWTNYVTVPIANVFVFDDFF